MVIYPYLYNDSINASWVNVTLDTNYPKLWNDTLFNASRILEDDLNLQYTTVDVVDKKIYINTNHTAPRYLKYPDQTASGPLYAGMISYSVEDPDGSSTGNGGGGGSGGGDYNGTGDGVLSSGSQWLNIPSSENMTKMDITNIAFDDTQSLENDVIMIIVNDDDGDWWKLIIDFKAAPSDRINSITARSGATSKTSAYTSVLLFPLSYPIDLWSISNYDQDYACYQKANIDQPNCLVSYLGDDSSLKNRAVVFYELEIDD